MIAVGDNCFLCLTRFRLLASAHARYPVDGLSSLRSTVVKHQVTPLFTRVVVRLNQKAMLLHHFMWMGEAPNDPERNPLMCEGRVTYDKVDDPCHRTTGVVRGLRVRQVTTDADIDINMEGRQTTKRF